MTNSVNIFKQRHLSNRVKRHRNWNRMSLWAGWEVERPVTGRNAISEGHRDRRADPATILATSRRLVTTGKVNSLEFVFWPSDTKIENDASPGGIKQTNRNPERWSLEIPLNSYLWEPWNTQFCLKFLWVFFPSCDWTNINTSLLALFSFLYTDVKCYKGISFSLKQKNIITLGI